MLVELVLLGVLLYLLRQTLKKPSHYPPGKWGLPLVGYVPLHWPPLQDYVRHLNKKHGDIYVWRLGTRRIVYVHDYLLIRDAFNRQEFTSRPDFENIRFMEGEGRGVLASNDAFWLNNRRFSLRQLRDLGMGKSKLVEAVHRQATWLAEVFRKQAGHEAPVPYVLRLAIVNIIWQLVGGIQFDIDDPKMKEYEELREVLLGTTVQVGLHDFFPWLGYILPPFIYDRLVKRHDISRAKDKILAYFNEVIAEHEATLNPGEPRDLIDGYLMEMEQRKDSPDNTFTRKELAFLMLDMFFGGIETVTATLTWLFYYLASYPRVQKKLQAEIDAVLRDGRHATLEDKPRMPYSEAVINEVLRKSSLVPFSVPHMATQDTTLGGYFIPEGTLIMAVTFSMHCDPRYWDKPEEFLPERWLDSEGKVVTKKEGFLPFSVGCCTVPATVTCCRLLPPAHNDHSAPPPSWGPSAPARRGAGRVPSPPRFTPPTTTRCSSVVQSHIHSQATASLLKSSHVSPLLQDFTASRTSTTTMQTLSGHADYQEEEP